MKEDSDILTFNKTLNMGDGDRESASKKII